MRRSELKRTKTRRPMDSATYDELKTFVEIRDKGICIGVRAGVFHQCGVPYDAEHLVEQRDIRKVDGAAQALKDPRLATFCCRSLNGVLHTYGWLKLAADLERTDLTNIEKDLRARAAIRHHAPEGFEDAVKEYGLEAAADGKLGGVG